MGTGCKSNPAVGGRHYGSPQCLLALAPEVPSGTGPFDKAVQDWQLTLAIQHTVNHVYLTRSAKCNTNATHTQLSCYVVWGEKARKASTCPIKGTFPKILTIYFQLNLWIKNPWASTDSVQFCLLSFSICLYLWFLAELIFIKMTIFTIVGKGL